MPSQLIVVDGAPRSSCCQAPLTAHKEYTDTHHYDVTSCEVNERGFLVAYYRFAGTSDGIDGENFRVQCSNCFTPIDDTTVEFEER